MKIKHYIKKKVGKHTRNKIYFVITAGIFVFALIIIWISSFKIPDFNSFNERKIANSTKIYDRTGEILLYNIHQDAKRTDIPFDQMGENIKNATLAIEDAKFYNHNGVRISSTFRAVLSNIFHIGIGGGGSTITQQLIKNTLLTQKRTFTRKIKEWVLALKIEREFSKDKIFEYYLNEAPYGGNLYGISEASRTYFNKNPTDLSVAEAAYLAAIPQSPTVLSPYGKNLQKLEARKNLVLSRMREVGFLNEESYQKTKNEVVVFSPKELTGIHAPHFVFFIKDYLENKYGTDAVEQGGLKVTTTLDYDLQIKGEAINKEGALKNKKDWNGENASIVAIDPKTGQILTMIGSRDYFDKEIDGNFNVATALRQPGSSFKPFIYATAFSKGFTPETVLFDLPTEFNASCTPYGRATTGSQKNCYMPENYDGKTVGPINLRNALAQSRNIPAVKLFYLSGLSDSLKTAQDMGITSLTDINRYGLTLVIGGGEVSLLDITSAYGVFANNGIRNPYTGILKVEDINGNVLEEFEKDEKQILSKNTALTISNILSDNTARIPTFGANSQLKIDGYDVAVKTGTTNNNKDAWTVGYSPTITVGVWAGNNDNKPMKKGGVSVAGPIWNKFIKEALKKSADEKFEKPNIETNIQTTKPILRGQWLGGESFFIDKTTGLLATEFTPKETLEEKIITSVHTILHWVDRSDITGASPSNPQSNSQYNNWEVPIQNWWAQNSYKYNITTILEKPMSYDNIHTQNTPAFISIIDPNNTNIYPLNEEITLQISNPNNYPIQKIDVFINNIFIESIRSPFYFKFTPSDLENIQNENELKLIVSDNNYNKSEVSTIFKTK
ncbi:MAG: transglycosylase domain-containing protein [bacterium]|nr:transglycosylase domain-containing protein [bacterium]